MKKKIMAGAVLLLAASIFIGGCGIKSVSTDTGAGYTVTDATGREVKIPKKPERIMGNSASIDTMLLGVVTPDKLIAASDPVHVIPPCAIGAAVAGALSMLFLFPLFFEQQPA